MKFYIISDTFPYIIMKCADAHAGHKESSHLRWVPPCDILYHGLFFTTISKTLLICHKFISYTLFLRQLNIIRLSQIFFITKKEKDKMTGHAVLHSVSFILSGFISLSPFFCFPLRPLSQHSPNAHASMAFGSLLTGIKSFVIISFVLFILFMFYFDKANTISSAI